MGIAWKSLLATALTAGAAGALRTSFSIRELQAIADDAAALESKYRQTSARALTGHQPRDQINDVDPSLLYPAYNLTVPIDHFHNDSIYEPHVCMAQHKPPPPTFFPPHHQNVDFRRQMGTKSPVTSQVLSLTGIKDE